MQWRQGWISGAYSLILFLAAKYNFWAGYVQWVLKIFACSSQKVCYKIKTLNPKTINVAH